MLKTFVKDMAKYAPSQFLPALTAFITIPILTRLFPPSEYGSWALATSISAFLVALAASGFGSAVLRYYPIYQASSSLDAFFAVLIACVSASTALVALIGFLAVILAKAIYPPALYGLLPLVIMIFVAQSIFTIFTSVLRAQGRSGSFTYFQLFTNYGGLGVGLLLVLVWGFRVDGLLWGALIILVLTLPLLILLTTKGVSVHPQSFHLSDALQVFQYAWPLTLGNVAMWGLRVSDLFMIGLFRSEGEVGLYAVSYNLSARSIELLVTLFLLSVSPLVFSVWEREGRAATEKTLTMVTRIYLIVCLPAAVGLSVLAYPFVALLTAPAYQDGYQIVPFVVFSSFVWGLSNIAMMGIAIKKQALRLGANQIIAAGVHIGLQLLFVPRFGYIVCAISTLIGYTVLLALQTSASRPHLTWKLPFSTLRNVIVASAAMGLVAYGSYRVSGFLSKHSPIDLFLSIMIAVPVYLGCLWWVGEVREDEKNTVLHIWRRLKARAA